MLFLCFFLRPEPETGLTVNSVTGCYSESMHIKYLRGGPAVPCRVYVCIPKKAGFG